VRAAASVQALPTDAERDHCRPASKCHILSRRQKKQLKYEHSFSASRHHFCYF
jgi:hypothetical protein